jgi:sRNA-binding protein
MLADSAAMHHPAPKHAETGPSDQRVTLDGAPAEPVDAEAKELATKQLARLAARKAAKQTAAAKAKPKPKPAPTA